MLLIGERINATRKSIQKALTNKDADLIQEQARNQDLAGADYICVNTGLHPAREKDLMVWAIENIQQVTEKPLCIDSANPEVIEAALAVSTGTRPMVNSMSMKSGAHESILPLVHEHNTKLVALTQDDRGVPEDVDTRLRITERIVKACTDHHIDLADVFIDPLVLALSVDDRSGATTIRSIQAIKEHWPRVKVLSGIGNISFGLPHRGLITRTYLAMMFAIDVDAIFVDPLNRKMMSAVMSASMLIGRDKMCADYIQAFRSGLLQG